jgi:glyceraldehyde 3-phosphate dehydrogenase
MNIGINGFGRIGKCIFLQLINDSSVNITAVNINNLEIVDFEHYINYDSIHKTNKYSVKIEEDKYIIVNKKRIKIFNEKDPKKIDWLKEGVEYLFETTGKFLTKEDANKHNSKYVLISAPAKDDTPTFCYGVNENEYKGENIVSGASCTTNCIAPFIKYMSHFTIKNANFITIHSATPSQAVSDSANLSKRTYRSILNNIIPHTTGASKSLDRLFPELKNKIIGTSVRVPVSNVSMVDINIEFENDINKDDIIEYIEKNKSDIVTLNYLRLVSSDFIGTTVPTIIDEQSIKQLTSNKIKFGIWYDNEWSYSCQTIKLMKHIFNYNDNL